MNRRRLLLLLIPFLLWLMVQAAIGGYSYVIQYRANGVLDGWQKSPGQLSQQAWLEVEASVLAALSWDKEQPDLINLLGRLHDLHTFRLSRAMEQKQQHMQQAEHYYRQVIKLRPAWPYGYLNLAHIKTASGSRDSEFYNLLLHLTRLAPWDEKTLPLMVQMLTRSWPYMDSEERSQLQPYLLQVANQRPNDVKRALQKSGTVTYFCAKIIGRQPTKLCGNMMINSEVK